MCTTEALPWATYLAEEDHTDPARGVHCQTVSEFEQAARAGYWLFKAFRWVKENVPPIPPP